MIVVLLPGFCRLASEFAFWNDLLPAEVRPMNLPGHGGEQPVNPPTLAAMEAFYLSRIPRDAVILGESLGGLVALKMAGLGYRAIAVDPPLSPEKSWPLQAALPKIVRQYAGQPWVARFVESFFGSAAEGPPQPRDYWPLLDAVERPVHILAASEPLWPVRPAELTPATAPSVLDEGDAERLRSHPKVRFRMVQGPHTLLTDAVETTRQALLEILAEP